MRLILRHVPQYPAWATLSAYRACRTPSGQVHVILGGAYIDEDAYARLHIPYR